MGALREEIFRLNPLLKEKVTAHATKLEGAGVSPITGFFFVCTDNMSGRRDAFERFKGSGASFFCDIRLSPNSGSVWVVEPGAPESSQLWEDGWFPNERQLRERCTARMCRYGVLVGVGIALKQLGRHLQGLRPDYHTAWDLSSPMTLWHDESLRYQGVLGLRETLVGEVSDDS